MTITSRRESRCSECGSELHKAQELGSICARCAFGLGLAADPTAGDGSTDATLALPAEPPLPLPQPPQEMPERIGRYRLLEELGSGGMGVVYRALQDEPVRREVALKLIKLGMDTKQILARFETERQALALMDHPNIARVYDGGVETNGRPYFVMEYVKGIPITEYCETQRLTTEERLRLLMSVADGVQHAHRKGILHRDLKPSNVLVSLQDGAPVAKIIDFGVAKATGARLTEQTLYTEVGQWIGTPDYMSPEQCDASALDVDTRTDVYSLGVMLYELLIGVRPHDTGSRLRTPEELRKSRLEDEPVRPSTRLQRLNEESTAVAERQRTHASALVRRLRGELDWVVMKALERERSRRYGSPSELRDDLERFLEDRPVEARPPSARYRLSKFVRRHRVAVAAAGFVVLSLLTGAGLAIWQAVRATRAEQAANREAEAARQVSRFLTDLFQFSDPLAAQGEEISVRGLLDRGAERVETELAEQPLVRAQMMEVMGTAYQNLGAFEPAGRLLEEALRLREAELGDEQVEVASSRAVLGRFYLRSGDYEAARLHLERALAVQERELGPDDRAVAETLNSLGGLEMKEGDYPAAQALFERTLAIWERLLGEDDPAVARLLNNLAGTYWQQGQYVEARPLFERSLAIKEKQLGPNSPSLSAGLANLGLLEWRVKNFAEARALFERALAIDEAALGAEHPDVASDLNNLAIVVKAMGEHDRALELYGRSIRIKEKAFGETSSEVAWAVSNRALLFRELGRYEEARVEHERALAIRRKAFGPDHQDLAYDLAGLAAIAQETGELDRALELFEQAIDLRERHLGGNHDLLAETLGDYAALLRRLGRDGDAAAAEARAQSIVAAARGARPTG